MRLFTTLGFLLTYALCSGILPSTSAAAAKPATSAVSVYVSPQLTLPVWSNDSLTITVQPDEQACKKLYKEKWQEGCATAIGQEGAPVGNLRMTPTIQGQWRWSDSTTMTFTPTQPWPAATKYTVALNDLPLPARVRMVPATLNFTTLPLAATMDKGEVWIDPDINGKRALSFAIHFTSPPDRASFEQQTRLTSTDTSLTHSPLHFVWTEGDTRCLVSAQLLTLPQHPAVVHKLSAF